MQVLLADDQTKLSETMKLWLEQIAGATLVGVALNVTSLLEQVQRVHPDILLLDWKLDGLVDERGHRQLLARLHALLPTMRIVALTTEPIGPHMARQYAVDAFVSKSETPDYLAQVLQQLHQVINESR
ncbi:MAG: response regulator [Caldilineaceae bacterium]